MVKRVTKMGRISLPMDVRSTSDIPAFENMLTKGPMAVILVYADWCGHCNTYKENIWSPLKSTKGRKLNMASVHYDQLENTSLKNSKIEGYPSLLVVGTDKKPATFNTDSGVTNAMPNANELSTMKKIITAPVNTSKNRNSLRNVNVEDTNVENMNSSLENMDSLRNTNSESMNSLTNINSESMNSLTNINSESMNSLTNTNSESMNSLTNINSESMNSLINTNSMNSLRNTNSMNSLRNTNSMNTNSITNNSNIRVSTEETPGATVENITPPDISSDTVSTLSSGTSSPLQPVRSLNSASNSVDEENKPLRNNTQGTTPLLRGGGGLYRKLTGKKQKKSKKRTVKRKN